MIIRHRIFFSIPNRNGRYFFRFFAIVIVRDKLRSPTGIAIKNTKQVTYIRIRGKFFGQRAIRVGIFNDNRGSNRRTTDKTTNIESLICGSNLLFFNIAFNRYNTQLGNRLTVAANATNISCGSESRIHISILQKSRYVSTRLHTNIIECYLRIPRIINQREHTNNATNISVNPIILYS